MAKAWEKISKHAPLKTGDRISMKLSPRFNWLGRTINTYATAARISKLEDDERFNVLRWVYNNDDSITVELIIVQEDVGDPLLGNVVLITPAVIIAIVLGVSVILVSAICYKVVDRAGEILEEPGGQVAASAIGIGSVAVLGVVVLMIWKLKK